MFAKETNYSLFFSHFIYKRLRPLITVPPLESKEYILDGTLFVTYSDATYRTLDGSQYFKFRYIDTGSFIEIDIIESPSYGSRNTSLEITHRLPSLRGSHYKICITPGLEPKNIELAKKISVEFAELTHKYIKTGIEINKQVKDREG